MDSHADGFLRRMTFTTNAADSAYRPGLGATCLALASLLAILGAVPGPGAEESRPGLAARCPGADCAAPPARGVTVYRGLVKFRHCYAFLAMPTTLKSSKKQAVAPARVLPTTSCAFRGWSFMRLDYTENCPNPRNFRKAPPASAGVAAKLPRSSTAPGPARASPRASPETAPPARQAVPCS